MHDNAHDQTIVMTMYEMLAAMYEMQHRHAIARNLFLVLQQALAPLFANPLTLLIAGAGTFPAVMGPQPKFGILLYLLFKQLIIAVCRFKLRHL